MAKKKKGVVEQSKIFVLDTNVLLHDHNCLNNFQDNDIVIPLTVLDELDHFKEGNETINFNAREIGRTLDKLSNRALFTQGVSLGKGLGKLTIVPGKGYTPEMELSLPTRNADHQILATALWVKQQNPQQRVILVSKDSILRTKAKSLDLEAEDYRTDMVKDLSILTEGIQTVGPVDGEMLDRLIRGEEGGLPIKDLGISLHANQCVEVRGPEDRHELACYDSASQCLVRVIPQSAYGITPRNSEQALALHLLTQRNIPLVSLTGKAGTGKTLLALAAALAQEEEFECIMLARPIVPLGNRDIGFLPGDANAKIAPYTQPLFDNLAVIKSALRPSDNAYRRIETMVRNEKLVITPLAYIRGRSLSNTFLIIDEAQNLTPHEIKTIITRGGEGARMVFTGDIYQIDQPYLNTKSNGLSYMTERMLGQPMFGHINLVKGERSALADLANEIL